MNLTEKQKEQFSDILTELSKSLDISESEYNSAVSSYMAVGTQLSKEDSILYPYDPEILPQGSFLIGTMIKPINNTDDLDIDLVCQLSAIKSRWTQSELKQKVGEQLKENKVYEKLLESPDGRRCWTLRYRENAEDTKRKYHMDILPSIVDTGFRPILEKAFSRQDLEEINTLAIRITDKEREDYFSERNQLKWLKSNPFGYAIWFQNRARLNPTDSLLLEKAIQAVPNFQKEKLPLQIIVQILKRHRDLMFSTQKDKEDKPISIIITTLTAKAYEKEKNILQALINVVKKMSYHIEDRYDNKLGKTIKWISNPVNDEENFADKWVEHEKRQINFYSWLKQVENDLYHLIQQRGTLIHESLKKSFGKDVVNASFNSYGDNILKERESGSLKMAAKTGMIGSEGRTIIPQHQNFGKNE